MVVLFVLIRKSTNVQMPRAWTKEMVGNPIGVGSKNQCHSVCMTQAFTKVVVAIQRSLSVVFILSYLSPSSYS